MANLSTQRITVGLPVYKGADRIAKSLECLQRQTFGNFEAIISVDDNDAETAAACRPFLVDPRFRMVVQPRRLDWVGNFNWLLQQDLKEFFCYRQHDDTTAPEFFEVLLQAADNETNAAAVYCDCQFIGRDDFQILHSIEGESLDRMLQYIERGSAVPVRGLIRRAAIQQAGLVRSDEFRAPHQIYGWLAKLVRWGNFRRIPKALYYKLEHPKNFTGDFFAKPEEQRRAAWPTIFTGLLEAAMPLCRTPEERLYFQQTILGRLVTYRPFYPGKDSSGRLITECLERLRVEGNEHLLREEEVPRVIQEVETRLALFERSQISRVLYDVRQRSRFGRLIYPKSRMRRVMYIVRYLLERFRYKMTRMLLPE